MNALVNNSNGKSDQHTARATWLGQLFFTGMSHSLYDLGLYRFVTPAFWRCPTEVLLDNYADNITNRHLEIGVGSGYFLHHTLCADFLKRLCLLDLNKRCLQKSAHRLQAYTPATLHQSASEPLAEKAGQFSSAGMNYVLHCIPGSFSDNRAIFENVHTALEDGGTFFGATLLPGYAKGRLGSRIFMRLLNRLGIFHNDRHNAEDLAAVLESVFGQVELTQVGDAAIFRCVKAQEAA